MKLCPSSPAIWTYVTQRGIHKGRRVAITYYALRRVIHTAFAAAGIEDFRIHDLRHDFASKLLRKTRNLALVKSAMGHSDIKSTLRYAHVLGDEIAQGMEGMTPGIVPESVFPAATKKKEGV
jgi:site-specific recombinase XerD